MPAPPRDRLSRLAAGLTDLVLPGGCAGCAGAAGQPLRRGVCDDCIESLARTRPRPTRPDPAPPGLPRCATLADYQGVLRELVLAYKDRGQHRLALPLGRMLAVVVESLELWPALLVPIPDTPAAARARYGDHLWRLARSAAPRLRAAGHPVAVARPLRARPRPDSAGLDTAQRAAQAADAFAGRPLRAAGVRRWQQRTGGQVVLLDDVVTTGATLAAAAATLATAGIPVAGAAVLAATRRRRVGGSPDRLGGLPSQPDRV